MAKKTQSKQIIEGDESRHYVSPRKKRGRTQKAVQPPLTPMIDVTFQLLIFFLLTAQFLPPEGDLAAAVPLAQTEEVSQPPTELTITVRTPVSITPSALYTVNDRTVRSSEELYEALLRFKADYPDTWKDTVVKIERDEQARYQFYVDAYNQARRAEFEKVGLPALKN